MSDKQQVLTIAQPSLEGCQTLSALIECGYEGDAEEFAKRLRETLSRKNLFVGPVPKPRELAPWRGNTIPKSWM